MLFEQLVRCDASRTFCTAGSNSPIRIAIIAITTSNSIRVKAIRCLFFRMVVLAQARVIHHAVSLVLPVKER
jgi:hypothetical protein